MGYNWGEKAPSSDTRDHEGGERYLGDQEDMEIIEEHNKAFEAATAYLNRKNRLTHPAGRTDNGGRWMPSESEMQTCCKWIRTPSRAFPWSLMTHCRSLEHVANLYGVAIEDARAAVKAINAAQKEATK